MRFGSYDCAAVEMDAFLLDGGAMFGVVPKTLWGKKIPADSKNRIPMTARSLIICGNHRTILVDAGIGDKLSAKLKKVFGMVKTPGSMDARLAPLGLTAEDITDVVITHLHFDHAGGCTALQNKTIVPAFPQATYHIQKSQWELACHPSLRDRSGFIADDFMPLYAQKVLNIIDGPTDDLFEGIYLMVTQGHTAGQQHLLVKGEGRSLFFCADLIPTAAHLPLTWHMGYDNLPLALLEEKRGVIQRALFESWILCFPHDPHIAAASISGRVERVEVKEKLFLKFER